ncbi:EAL domain-containing protein [Microbaculum sp. FT89]|uniref:EAL domain-containing protein n=1 Tax=Microbaculum sp. FT89 TaxID=3447298 RepID=UPI003F53BE35
MSVSSPVEADTLRGLDEPRSVLPSPSPWFVAFCMVVIAGSLATILYARVGMSVAEAGWIGFAALLIMVLAEFYSARARERSAVEAELREVVRVSGRFQDEIAALNERIADIEATLTVRVDDMIEERVETIVADMRQIEDRIEGLAETVSTLEGAAPATRGALAAAEIGGQAAGASDTLEETPAFPGMSDAEAAAILRRSVEEHGPLIHLQSIVTLPQRRVRYYEAFARLRTDEGRSLMPRQFIPLAERTGIMPIIDNAVLFRTVQILRKIARKNNDVGVFCNISARSLGDGEFFQQFVDFMGENRNLSGAIVFEFTQAAFDDLGPIELANLDALAELGFRFSLDNVTRLDIDGARLAKHGVRYIKIDAETLMQPPLSASAHIHAADLAKLLARYGITLIATRVESESQVVDILDYDVRFAQGNLFSPPRIVRAEAAQAARNPTIN